MPDIKYYAISVPGLERVVWTEIKNKLAEVQLNGEARGRIMFTYSGDPRDLLYLRSAENVYVFVKEIRDLTRSRKSLGEIYDLIRQSDFESASMLHKQTHRSKGRRHLTFRVISSMIGRHNFRRVDVQKSVETALSVKCGWRLIQQDPLLEVRVDLEEDKTPRGQIPESSHAILGLRLSDETMSNRPYKIFHLPASLKPTVAYSMALLSDPEYTDVFIDPMCGAGTIPIERAFAGPYKTIIAGDVDEGIVHSALGNVQESHRAVNMAVWNVSDMPISNRSVDKLVCNLPFGKQIGSPPDNQALYSRFFKEMPRIMKARGRAVLLSSAKGLMDELISQYSSMKVRRVLKIDLLGVKAYIYVIDF